MSAPLPPRARKAAQTSAEEGVRVLKKYPNRRLYDTQASSYITLADVKAMVMRGEHFEVRDAKSGEDITRSILLQIILEEETGGMPMFSSQALAQIIRFYGHAMQSMMGTYLERNLQAFTDAQQQFAQASGLSAPDHWGQAMSAYMEQSQQMLTQMQKQAGDLLRGFVPPPRSDD